MSQKTVGLIIALILVTGILVYTAVAPKQPAPATPSTTTPTTPAVLAQTTLALSPSLLSLSSNSGSLNVVIDSGSNKITAVQLELSYDPKMLSAVDITPGAFFDKPVTLIKTIDDKNGKISYALGIAPTGLAKSGQGAVATITFSSAQQTGQATQITFSPKTLVTAEGANSSVLKATSGAAVVFTQSQSNTILPIKPTTSTSSGY